MYILSVNYSKDGEK